MINPSLEKEKLKDLFTKNKFVEVSEFLSNDYAEYIFQFLNIQPESYWTASFHPVNNNKSVFLKNNSKNQELIEKHKTEVQEVFNKGKFSFFFYSTIGKHPDKCNCSECTFKEFLSGHEIIYFLKEITDVPLLKCSELFCSKYENGNFLSPHHDKNKGKIGFILNLSKNWLPQFGGNLYFMEQDWFSIRKVITPKFNNLILFDVPSYKGIPHFVSHVSPGVQAKRLAVAGWFL